MLKVLDGARIAQDTDTGDIYIIGCVGSPIKITDAPKVISIAIVEAPTKTSYTVGEEFDPAGMVVAATYDNGSVANVAGYTYVPTEELKVTDTEVAIQFAGKTAVQAIVVSEPESGDT